MHLILEPVNSVTESNTDVRGDRENFLKIAVGPNVTYMTLKSVVTETGNSN